MILLRMCEITNGVPMHLILVDLSAFKRIATITFRSEFYSRPSIEYDGEYEPLPFIL